MSAKKRTGGWGEGAAEPAPFGALPVAVHDDIKIPPILEGAKEIRGGVPTNEIEEGDGASATSGNTHEADVASEQGELRFSGGWLTGHE